GVSIDYEPLIQLKRPQYDFAKTAAAGSGPGGTLSAEMSKIFELAPLRQDRLAEILPQLALPTSFFAALLNLQQGRFRNTLELMSVGAYYASVVGQQFKDYFRVIRPADRSALVQPILLTPRHGSYPAGHATQCHLLRVLLAELTGAAARAAAGSPPDTETLKQL